MIILSNNYGKVKVFHNFLICNFEKKRKYVLIMRKVQSLEKRCPKSVQKSLDNLDFSPVKKVQLAKSPKCPNFVFFEKKITGRNMVA